MPRILGLIREGNRRLPFTHEPVQFTVMSANTLIDTQAPSAQETFSKLWSSEVWVFDLDNTLYPASLDLFSQIDDRMRAFIAAYLGLDLVEARRLQKQYFNEYGTSLRGMMERHGMDPSSYLDHVHEIDLSALSADPDLNHALSRLPGHKFIFTNASARHAERVIERLNIGHHFEGIFDIVDAQFRPKPDIHTYRRVIERYDLDPGNTVMVEDMARNLHPASELGMTTVWVRAGSTISATGMDDDKIDHIVDDLAVWLTAVADARQNATDDG